MLVGKTREMLEHEVRKSIYDINLSKDYRDGVTSKLLQKGYSGGDVQRVIGGNVPLELLSDVELGVFTDAIYKVTDNMLINPESFYTDIELKEIRSFRIEGEEQTNKKLVFEDMLQQSEDQWIGKISVQDLVKLLQSKKVRYNYETQRNAIYIKHKGDLIKRPNINPKSVEEIKNEMVAGTYIYDTITLNVYADEFDRPQATSKAGGLLYNIFIPDDVVDIVDGMHRAKASESAVLVNPNITGNFILMLTYFDKNKANDYIVQVDKRNPLDEEYKASINIANKNNDVVKQINESTKSDLRGLIATDELMVKEGLAVTYFSIMSKTIEKLWNPTNRAEVRQISNYLIDFFNELVGIFEDELKNSITNNRNKNLINHPNMFVYYLIIAKELEGKDNWINLLYKIINNTDFSKDNDEWRGYVTYLPSNRFNSRLSDMLKIYKQKIRGEMNERK